MTAPAQKREPDTEAAITGVAMDLDRFQSDPDGFASILTEDAVVVNAVGRRVEGRAAMRSAMAAALQTPLANVRTRLEILDLRRLTDDVALVGARKYVETGGSKDAPARSEISVNIVLVRRDEGWRVALVHNTLVH